MPKNDKFPSPTATVQFLNSEESTSYDVLAEFKELFDPNHIFAICQTEEDMRTYANRLKSIAKKLKSSLPDDTAMKYFFYGRFAVQADILSKSAEAFAHPNLCNAREEI